MSPAAYPYRRLEPQCIRLLTIYPGSTGLVVCDLEEVNIQQPPPYEALSYCWGDPDIKKSVKCNGLPFDITQSLHSALVRVRLPSSPRVIWADAICINQSDTAERNAQVLLMQDIYRQATSVIIWLGSVEAEEYIWPIPHLLEAAQKNRKRTQLPIRHDSKDWVNYALRNQWTVNGDLEDKKWHTIIQSVIRILQQPWFLRTWIIQEVALARQSTILCGVHSATWDDFYRAVSYAIDLEYFSNTAPETYRSIRSIENTRCGMQRAEQRLLDLLSSFRIFRATDPRDKVFGLYGLLSPSNLARMAKPDYEMSVESVYAQAAIDCITLEESLDVLSLADGGYEDSMPSWIPRLTLPDRAQPLLPRFLLNQSFGDFKWQTTWSSASGNSLPTIDLSKDKVFSLLGCVFDKVVTTGGILDKSYSDMESNRTVEGVSIEGISIFKESYDVFEAWEKLCGMPGDAYFTGERASDVFWKTLHAGGLPYGDEAKTKAEFHEWYRPFKSTADFFHYSKHGLDHLDDKEYSFVWKAGSNLLFRWNVFAKGFKMAWAEIHQMEQTTMLGFHRTMIQTEKGYVGLTSRHVEEGDCVALFHGGKMPLVLREVAEGRWKLLSDAYIHGIMDGKLFDTLSCSMISLV